MNRLLGFVSLGIAVLAMGVALTKSGEVAGPAPVAEAPPSTAAQDLQALEKRIKALEDNAVHLSSRLMALERRPVVTDGGGAVAELPPAALAQEVEQLRAEVRGLIAGEALNSQGGREYLKEMVRSVQDEMRTAQREERQQQWIQAQAQAQPNRSERLRQFVAEAGLNYNQEQELARRLEGEETQRQALLAEVSAGRKSPQDMRRELRTLRSETDQQMQKLLSEEQRVKYEEMRREERRETRPGGRGGDRSGGAPGGG